MTEITEKQVALRQAEGELVKMRTEMLASLASCGRK
jgi:hypothetical protein